MRRVIAQRLRSILRFSDLEDAPDIPDPVDPSIPFAGHEGELVVVADDGTSIVFDAPKYDIICFFEGVIPNGQLILRFPFSRRVEFPANLSGSQASLGVAATAETVITLKKNLVEWITITFAASGTTGTFGSAAITVFEVGDVLTVHGPSPADATGADLGFTLNGEKKIK